MSFTKNAHYELVGWEQEGEVIKLKLATQGSKVKVKFDPDEIVRECLRKGDMDQLLMTLKKMRVLTNKKLPSMESLTSSKELMASWLRQAEKVKRTLDHLNTKSRHWMSEWLKASTTPEQDVQFGNFLSLITLTTPSFWTHPQVIEIEGPHSLEWLDLRPFSLLELVLLHRKLDLFQFAIQECVRQPGKLTKHHAQRLGTFLWGLIDGSKKSWRLFLSTRTQLLATLSDSKTLTLVTSVTRGGTELVPLKIHHDVVFGRQARLRQWWIEEMENQEPRVRQRVLLDLLIESPQDPDDRLAELCFRWNVNAWISETTSSLSLLKTRIPSVVQQALHSFSSDELYQHLDLEEWCWRQKYPLLYPDSRELRTQDPRKKKLRQTSLELLAQLLMICPQLTRKKYTNSGQSMLTYACDQGEIEVVKLILLHLSSAELLQDARVQIQTPVIFAIHGRWLNVIEVLLQHTPALAWTLDSHFQSALLWCLPGDRLPSVGSGNMSLQPLAQRTAILELLISTCQVHRTFPPLSDRIRFCIMFAHLNQPFDLGPKARQFLIYHARLVSRDLPCHEWFDSDSVEMTPKK